MSARRRTLGRGLDALLSTPDPSGAAESPTATAEAGLHNIPVDLLERGRYQPRHDLRTESLEELADSIRAQGVVQPIVVRPLAGSEGGTRYEIIAGERRWRAAQLAGLQEIPAVVRDVPDEAAVAMALIENIQRENLNPLEEARALERLIDEFGMTHQQAAKAVGRSRVAVTNLLRLLDLSPEVKRMVERRELEMGHARALLGISDAAAQLKAARKVASRGLSVRETERLVKRLSAPPGDRAAPKKQDPDVVRLEADLGVRLGTQVEV
ncbi:MAG: ParB/RepB/Spo0J family partition protein, partial [Gammaproteobacteria bacterium]